MIMFNAAGRAAVLAALTLAPTLTLAHDFTAASLVIQHPWTRATPGGAQLAVGYLTILNHGSSVDRLTGGSLEASQGFELHEMKTDNGVMTMRSTGPLDIPPGGSLTLSPSGKHIMFTGLKQGLKKGQDIQGTLVFERAGTVPVRFDVAGVGAKAPDEAEGHPAPSMTDMKMN